MQCSGSKLKYKSTLLKIGAWLKVQQLKRKENYSLTLEALDLHYKSMVQEIKSIAKELNVKEQEVREMEFRFSGQELSIDYSMMIQKKINFALYLI